jgi:hypothetical protein
MIEEVESNEAILLTGGGAWEAVRQDRRFHHRPLTSRSCIELL